MAISTLHAYLYATGVIMGSAFSMLSHHCNFFTCQHMGMQIRVATSSLVYRKARTIFITEWCFKWINFAIYFCKQGLKLSQKGLGQTTIGQMVNLMSNDVSRFDWCLMFVHYLWVGPLQTLIITCILLFVLGPSCLIGIAILILFVPLQSKWI